MSKLTKAERSWVADVQAVLDRCPSKRLGFYTTGDPTVTLWDRNKADDVFNALDSREAGEFCSAVEVAGAGFDASFDFPNAVESTAG